MGLIERGARALAESMARGDWDTLDATLQKELKGNVHAVLKAIRDPDQHMREAGAEIIRNVTRTESEAAHLNDAANTWRLMIDAGLT